MQSIDGNHQVSGDILAILCAPSCLGAHKMIKHFLFFRTAYRSIATLILCMWSDHAMNRPHAKYRPKRMAGCRRFGRLGPPPVACAVCSLFLPRLWLNFVMLSLWSASEITNPTLLERSLSGLNWIITVYFLRKLYIKSPFYPRICMW
jgi:hypothetical protein